MREEDTVCVGSDGLQYCKAVSYTHLDVYKSQYEDSSTISACIFR